MYINFKGTNPEAKDRALSRQKAEYLEEEIYPGFLKWAASHNIPQAEIDKGIRTLRETVGFHRRIADHESL